MSATSSLTEAFDSAKKDFLQKLTNPQDYDFSKFNSIDEVYDATDEIQEEQARSGTLRNLRKIQPYLDCLNQYAGVLDTFIQVKPEVLTLIWGPIKLLLQVSSTYIKSFDKLLEVMAQIGDCLPRFGEYGQLFGTSDRIKHVLCVFYKDVLDFHATVLNFFKLKKWRVFFESLWPRYASKISIILGNVSRHTILMQSEVTFADISEAHAARIRAFEEHERAQKASQIQEFEAVKLSLSPYLYDVDLERIRQKSHQDAGQWLDNEAEFRRWFNPNDRLAQLLWLEGIPGAGKTFLASTVINRALLEGRVVLFALISFRNTRETTSNITLRLLHSFIFQLVFEHKDLQPILHNAYESNYRQFLSTVAFAQDLLLKMLQLVEQPYMIVDGIDEIEYLERQRLLGILLSLCKDCGDLKLLIGSRGEYDIVRLLRPKALTIRVDHRNSKDIESYVNSQVDMWCSKFNIDGTTSLEIRTLLSSVALKAKGMFLYARLALDAVLSRSSLRDVREEACNLPDGLDEAYSRITTRIDKGLRPNEQQEARTILELVGCSLLPVTKQEIEQAITIRPGDRDLCEDGRLFRSFDELCGPIIEIQDNLVHFVHFTVKEYLFGPQSKFFLSKTNSHLNLAMKCMSYLSFDCFRTDRSDSEMVRSILRGDYAFQQYAEFQWIEHIKRYVLSALSQALPVSSRLCQNIMGFVDARENTELDSQDSTVHLSEKWLEPFKDEWPDIYDKLYDASLFCKKKREDLSLKEDSWKNLDPFTISATCIRIRRHFDILICPTKHHHAACHCSVLKSFYGPRLFKCDRPGCGCYRTGFETDAERDSHVLSHDRPFKCTFLYCDFAEIGFRSNIQLRQHSLKCHPKSGALSADDVESLGSKDLDALLSDAVKAGEVQYVRDVCDQTILLPSMLEKLLCTAASSSTVSMVKVLISQVIMQHEMCNQAHDESRQRVDQMRREMINQFRQPYLPIKEYSNIMEILADNQGLYNVTGELLPIYLQNSGDEKNVKYLIQLLFFPRLLHPRLDAQERNFHFSANPDMSLEEFIKGTVEIKSNFLLIMERIRRDFKGVVTNNELQGLAAMPTPILKRPLGAANTKVKLLLTEPLIAAIEADNLDIVKLFLDHGANVDVRFEIKFIGKQSAFDAAITNRNAKAIEVLLSYKANPRNWQRYLGSLFVRLHNDEENLKTMECINVLHRVGLIRPAELDGMLVIVAQNSCSIPLASFLIKLGANINSGGMDEMGIPAKIIPLYEAAQRTTKVAAEFMKFLLDSGADPTRKVNGRTPGQMRGAKNISKWLGMTWDELVESAKANQQTNDHDKAETLAVRSQSTDTSRRKMMYE